MMSLWFIIFLIIWYFIVSGYNARPQRPLPFPNLTDFQLSDIGKPVHIFEGIDYDQLPENLRDEYSDCYSDHTNCIRLRSPLYPVCGYYYYYGSFHNYISICELNLQNCLIMVNYDQVSKYGVSVQKRYIFYVGEGHRCEYYVRSLKGRMEVDNTTIANAMSV